jgi:hypothetical protein
MFKYLHTSLSNRTNNIMDPNIDVAQSKIFLDPRVCWSGRYFYILDFFMLSLETCFRKKISVVLLGVRPMQKIKIDSYI